MKKPDIEEGLEFWKTHVEGWKSSGLTRQVYCSQQGINYGRFVYRLEQIRKSLKKGAIHFVEAAVQPGNEASVPSGLQVILPNGVRICMGGEVSASLLEGILTCAASLGC
jgi:hypothetical protein